MLKTVPINFNPASTSTPTSFSTRPSHGWGYMTASSTRPQPLCGNAEGWGPLSPIRYDFTPCFLDVWISAVALFGIFFGAAAVLWLMRRTSPKPVQRDWHFHLKLVSFSMGCLEFDSA